MRAGSFRRSSGRPPRRAQPAALTRYGGLLTGLALLIVARRRGDAGLALVAGPAGRGRPPRLLPRRRGPPPRRGRRPQGRRRAAYAGRRRGAGRLPHPRPPARRGAEGRGRRPGRGARALGRDRPRHRRASRSTATWPRCSGACTRWTAATPAAIEARLAPLAAPGEPWRASAEEIRALAAIRRGETGTARRTLTALARDASAPQGVRDRAARLLSEIGG